MLHIDEFVTDEQEAGIYTWQLESDRLFGDTSIALLFGLDPGKRLKAYHSKCILIEFTQQIGHF